MINKNYVYILFKNDELELPLVVAETLEEMEKITNFHRTRLYQACFRNSVIDSKYRIKLVDTRDPEEKFDFAEYHKFCKKHNLKPNSASSLVRFRQSCFGV